MRKTFFSSSLLLLTSMWLQAQDLSSRPGIQASLTDEEWYRSPWIWVVGAAVLILVLVGLSRRKQE
jgi:hypothetical protein